MENEIILLEYTLLEDTKNTGDSCKYYKTNTEASIAVITDFNSPDICLNSVNLIKV